MERRPPGAPVSRPAPNGTQSADLETGTPPRGSETHELNLERLRPGGDTRAREFPHRLLTVVLALAGLAGAPASAGPAPVPAEARQESRRGLVEAARQNRARVAAVRRENGSAPGFTDRDLDSAGRGLTGLREATSQRERPTEGAAEEALIPPDRALPPTDLAPLPEGGEDANEDALDAPAATGPSERAEREARLRERLLDIEASLAAIGVNPLPAAPRNPTRFESPFGAPALHAEREEIRRELAELARRKPPSGR